MRFKQISCGLGFHRYRAKDIKVTMLNGDSCDVSRTCCDCGFTEHFLTKLTKLDEMAKRLDAEVTKNVKTDLR